MLKTILLAAILGAAIAQEVEAEDGIYTLTADTFNEFVQLNPGTLVLFHETTCGYCDRIKEAFRRIIEKNKEKYPELKAAVVDGEDQKIKEQNDVDKAPQLRLYVNKGFFAFYEEDFSDEGLQAFLDHYLPGQAEPLFIDSDRSYVRYNNKQNSIVLAFESVGEEEKEFALGLQRVVPDIPVYYMKSTSKYAYMVFPEDSSKSHYKMKMKRNFDEGDKFLGTRGMFEPRHILKIVWPYRKNKVEIFTERALNTTLRARRTAIYFFDDDYNSDAAEVFSKIILAKNPDALVLKSTLKEVGSERLQTLFGVTPEEFPTARIVRIKDGRVQKFRMEERLTEPTFTAFLDGFLADTLTEYKKNQKPADNTGKSVIQLNREELIEHIADSSKHLVVAFVGKKAPVTLELLQAAHSLLNNKNAFTLATVDVNRNDIEGINRNQIPIIQILTKTQRKRPLTYDGESTPEALAAYLNDSIEPADEL